VEKYRAKVSGPLLDRIDLHLEVPAVPYKDLSASADGTSSADMRRQVEAARAVQRTRFGGGDLLNGRMGPRDLRRHCVLDAEAAGLLKAAMETLGLSARAHDRILRVARTVADLDSAERIRAEHVAEAVGYRSLDRKFFSG
jgi:magnesium chelatase family protein